MVEGQDLIFWFLTETLEVKLIEFMCTFQFDCIKASALGNHA
uniref:Uncharacterized protein n=1 Tax=Rhizophora mucronata TaxID=61149 RepID=A0A2P2N0H0_RHIMU